MSNAKNLFTPILDLAGGIDGGVAFSRLYHITLPEIQAKADAGDELALEFIYCLDKVSQMCAVHLRNWYGQPK